MKKLFTFALLVCCFFCIPAIHAQKPAKTLTPIEFSDKMSDITDSLYARGSAWGVHFNEARKTKNFSSLKPYRIGVDNFISSSLKSLRSMPDVKNSAALRNAMIGFLEFEHKMVSEGFIPIEKIKSDASDAEIDKALTGLMTLSEKESDELKKVSVAQEAYAASNGFKIESEEEADEKKEK